MKGSKYKILFSCILILALNKIGNAQLVTDQLNPFTIESKDLKIVFGFNKEKCLRMQDILPEGNYKSTPVSEASEESGNEVFIHCTGENHYSHHGTKFTGSLPGMRLKYIERIENKIPNGKQIVITQKDEENDLKVESFYEYNDLSPVVRRYTRVTNMGTHEVGIEYVSSAIINNLNSDALGTNEENLRIYYAFNSWQAEGQWHKSRPSELGWNENGKFNLTGVSLGSIGSWSSIKYLPVGMVENTKLGLTWFWQIEHNGSWYCEISNTRDRSNYVYLGGPDAIHHHAWRNLKPGEVYQTVPVAVGCVSGGFDEAVAALTKYRRTMFTANNDGYKKCPVIFNDYMNCLFGDPTTEKELPMIEAASRAKCNYYVIDAGWYSELNEDWFGSVGLWQPSKTRFQNGLQFLLNTISKKGMIPGLWLEPEVIGINSPLNTKPDSWFLSIDGKRYIDNSRYFLDFRNPEVIAYITSVVDRLVGYGIGYIKMDYNNTIWGAQSNNGDIGQGLLEQNRAVLKWYKSIHEKYPDLVIENCGSGGCRIDYAMLSQTQIQSSSDQQDYRKYPAIIVGELAAVLPEQLAAWSYPVNPEDEKEASFNMVNGMLCRIQLSGKLDQLSANCFQKVTDAIDIYYSQIAPFISTSIPFFPLGMPSMQDTISPVAVGLRNDTRELIAVWRLAGDKIVTIPKDSFTSPKILYPTDLGIKIINETDKSIQIKLPEEYMAVIIELTK